MNPFLKDALRAEIRRENWMPAMALSKGGSYSEEQVRQSLEYAISVIPSRRLSDGQDAFFVPANLAGLSVDREIFAAAEGFLSQQQSASEAREAFEQQRLDAMNRGFRAERWN
jgi:hypothetical protein